MKRTDFLADEEQAIAFLINCAIATDKIQCGCAYFKGGISGSIQLYDYCGIAIAKVKIPPAIAKIFTFAVLTPEAPLDYLELEIESET